MTRTLTILLKGRGALRSEGSVLIRLANPREQLLRIAAVACPPAVLALLLAWQGGGSIALSIACAFVSVLSVAYQARSGTGGVVGSGPCPRCGTRIELNERAVAWPLRLKCAACQRMMTVQPAPRSVLTEARIRGPAVDAVASHACDKAAVA